MVNVKIGNVSVELPIYISRDKMIILFPLLSVTEEIRRVEPATTSA